MNAPLPFLPFPSPPSQQLVLSLFPGIDLFGRGFELAGFCVVRGPDLIFGGDQRRFHAPPGRFDGVIAGPPCQDFSVARRGAASSYGLAMLDEFERAVLEAQPAWWWLENVPPVPDVRIAGYSWLRIDLDPRDFGGHQRRLRHFQFGHRDGLVPRFGDRRPRRAVQDPEPCCIASEFDRPKRRGWARFCEAQGLPADFALPGFTASARYRAVGNGVHVGVAGAIAEATARAAPPDGRERLCACGCARVLTGKRNQQLATIACRKRIQRRRDRAGVTGPGPVTPGPSRFDVTELREPALEESR